jgi:hypothetical protein
VFLCEGNQSNLALLPNIQGHTKGGKIIRGVPEVFPRVSRVQHRAVSGARRLEAKGISSKEMNFRAVGGSGREV